MRHYKRLIRNGTPWGRTAEHGEPFHLRLDRYIEITEGNCWLWTGAKTTAGYGSLGVNGVTVYAHRWVFEQTTGTVPTELDHLCRNRACVNPDHLEDVPHAVNSQRGGAAILNPSKVRALRAQAAAGVSKHDLAAEYGISPQTVYGIVTRRRWRNI